MGSGYVKSLLTSSIMAIQSSTDRLSQMAEYGSEPDLMLNRAALHQRTEQRYTTEQWRARR